MISIIVIPDDNVQRVKWFLAIFPQPHYQVLVCDVGMSPVMKEMVLKSGCMVFRNGGNLEHTLSEAKRQVGCLRTSVFDLTRR